MGHDEAPDRSVPLDYPLTSASPVSVRWCCFAAAEEGVRSLRCTVAGSPLHVYFGPFSVSIACKGCPVTHHTHTHSVTHTHTTLRRYGTHTADKMTHCTFSMFSRGLVSDVRCFQKLPAIIWNQAALRTPPHIFLNKNNPDEAVCHCGDTFFAGFHLCNLKNNYYCDTSLSNSTILDREGLRFGLLLRW